MAERSMGDARLTPSTERKLFGPPMTETPLPGDVKESTNIANASDDELKVAKRLHQLVDRLVSATELHPLLDEALDGIVELQHAACGVLRLYNPQTKSLGFDAQRGFDKGFLDELSRLDLSTGFCGQAILERKRVLVEDLKAEPGFELLRQIATAAGFRAVQSTPLFSREGDPLGVVSTFFRQRYHPSEHELELTHIYVGIAEEIIQRRQSDERLRKSEERFRLLFDQMLVGCTLNQIVCDDHGNPIDRVYLEVNPAFEQLTGLRREDVIGKRMRDVFHDVEPFWIEKYGGVAQTGEPVQFEGYMRAIDKHFDVSVSGPQRGQFIVTFVDITSRKTLEAYLRSFLSISTKLNSTLDVDSLMDSLIVEAIGLANAEGGCAGLRTRDGMTCRRYFRGSEPISFEYCWSPGIGWPGWVLTHKIPYLTNDAANDPVIVPQIREQFGVKSGLDTPLIDTGGRVIGFFEVNNKLGNGGFTRADLEKLTAVSEMASIALQNALSYRKLAETEESLRQLWVRLLQVQDEERRRIGRELHDVAGQALTGLSMTMGVARRMLGVDEKKVQEALTEGLGIVKECSDAVRTLSYLLHSPVLEDGGLEAVLQPYVEGFSRRSGIEAELEMSAEDKRLPQQIEEAMFRVVQESLTNIHLHSGASSARIRVLRESVEATLLVQDDGHGIRAEVLEKIHAGGIMPGVGIASMQERIRQVGGWLRIDSGRQGTVLTARIPLKAEEP